MATPRLEIDNTCPTGKAIWINGRRLSCAEEGSGGGGILGAIGTATIALPRAIASGALSGGGSGMNGNGISGGSFLPTINGNGGGGGIALQAACAAAGLPPGCSWVDVAAAAARGLTGSGSEPPTGDQPVPGMGFGGGGGCPAGSFRLPTGQCVDIQPGGDVSGGGVFLTTGEAVNGRYGAGIVPQQQGRMMLHCPPGHVLGKDDVCYSRLRASDRKWPPGKKPLLTGGDLNAIARASRVAKKFKRKQRDLQRLGLIKRPKTVRGGSRGVITKAEAARALRS
jgi:hypothetical protein